VVVAGGVGCAPCAGGDGGGELVEGVVGGLIAGDAIAGVGRPTVDLDATEGAGTNGGDGRAGAEGAIGGTGRGGGVAAELAGAADP
jgi:hypothetical protein